MSVYCNCDQTEDTQTNNRSRWILCYRWSKSSTLLCLRDKYRDTSGRSATTVSILTKCFIFSAAVLVICLLLYIPMYNTAKKHIHIGEDQWSIHMNRDVKLYILPNNHTTIHEPKDVCNKNKKIKTNKLFLLTIVCSSITNFDKRAAIRDTWANYGNYLDMIRIFHAARQKYKEYDQNDDKINSLLNLDLSKVNVSQKYVNVNSSQDSNNDNSEYEEIIINNQDKKENENVQNEIPSLKQSNAEISSEITEGSHLNADNVLLNRNPDFKVTFIVGVLPQDDTDVQKQIEEEIRKYGDIIQEDFIDTYSNLTIKSSMMLKWIYENCGDEIRRSSKLKQSLGILCNEKRSKTLRKTRRILIKDCYCNSDTRSNVRYILKTDDDVYVNVPKLILDLRQRAREFDDSLNNSTTEQEFLLLGDITRGEKPILDSNHKWYSPKKMYSGYVYPQYVSGAAYAFTLHTAYALYNAVLRTDFFRLEDIYITGMCAMNAAPLIIPQSDPLFLKPLGQLCDACCVYQHVSVHGFTATALRAINDELLYSDMEECEKRSHVEKILDKARLYVMCQYVTYPNEECKNTIIPKKS